MRFLKLIKINEAFCSVECEPAVRYELSDYFTFFLDSAYWHPSFKNGFWDGKIRLLNTDMTIYTGLRKHIQQFCKERQYEYIEEGFSDSVNISPKKLVETIESWNPTRYDNNLQRVPLSPHKEQLAAIYAGLSEKRLIIESATSAGKSFIACALTRFLSRNKSLIIVPRVALVNQLLENYHEYFEDWNPGIDILYSGQKIAGENILISTWQSLYKKPKKFFEDFQTVIYDEVHEAESKSAQKILESSINAEYRIGLTGTLKDAKSHILTLNGLFGKNYKFSKTSENIKKGVSANLNIEIHNLQYKNKLVGEFNSGSEKYRAELDYIWFNKNRNIFLYDKINSYDGTTLILFKNVDHGRLLYKEYTKKFPDKKAFLIYGGIDKTKREQIKKYVLEHPEDDIQIFASIGTYSTGINIPSIKTIILAGPIKDKIKLLQSIGRGLRIKKDGSSLLFIDMIDDIPKGGILKKQGRERINRYIKEDFNYRKFTTEL